MEKMNIDIEVKSGQAETSVERLLSLFQSLNDLLEQTAVASNQLNGSLQSTGSVNPNATAGHTVPGLPPVPGLDAFVAGFLKLMAFQALPGEKFAGGKRTHPEDGVMPLSMLPPSQRDFYGCNPRYYYHDELQPAPDPLEGYSFYDETLRMQQEHLQNRFRLERELRERHLLEQGQGWQLELEALEERYLKEMAILEGNLEAQNLLTKMYQKDRQQILEHYDEMERQRRLARMRDMIEENRFALAGYRALETGFMGMFDSMIQIQTESNNALIRGFTAMANAFVREVSRMISRWLAFNMIMHLFGSPGVSFGDFWGFSSGGAVPFEPRGQHVASYALGGLVEGPGTPTSDQVAAWLSPGEFVINAGSATRNRSLLDSLNRGDNRIEALLERIARLIETQQTRVDVHVDPLDPVRLSRLNDRGKLLRMEV